MKILKIYPTSINARFIDEAVAALRAGELIVYPTDTLYAVGCNALDKQAVDRLCRLKGINPAKSCLSIVCSGISMASEYARIDNRAFRCLREYLPGPYTFILPAATTLPKVFKDRKAVGIRVPDCAISTALAEALGAPLLTTSVTPDADGPEQSVSDPGSVALTYSTAVPLMIDGGSTPGEPSTVIDLCDSSAPTVIRQGAGEWNE